MDQQCYKALINWIGRSVQEYIAFSLFRIDLPSVGQYGKSRGQYIPALTSHSVNKSIVQMVHVRWPSQSDSRILCMNIKSANKVKY